MTYDAAIIGAGANGLTAAAVLARAGLKTVVIERATQAGGRLVTESFHPGHAASPFADHLAPIPPAVTAALNLRLPLTDTPPPGDIAARRDAALTHVFDDAATPRRHGLLTRLRRAPPPPAAVWPGQDLATRALRDWPQQQEMALAGRSLDPDLAGSALALLALPSMTPRTGGLGVLGAALTAAASGAELRLGLEASEVLMEPARFGRAARTAGVLLADGSRIPAAAVISTLDFKRSVLGLFRWKDLPPDLTETAAAFRMGGGTARLLLALNHPPALSAPLFLPDDPAGDESARAAFRRGVLPLKPPLLLDPVSLRDPSLAPAGGGTLTVTLGCIPAFLFDGAWTHARRLTLAARALARIEAALPGTLAALTGIRIIAPPDIEERLGVSGGDLDGGLLTPDQMLGFRPGVRTPLRGFYLGGRSTAAGPLGTGAAGFAAAVALLVDRKW